MPEIPFDPFPTPRLSVPNLSELLTRLRDPDIKKCITIVHAKREGEGEWVLGNAAARLMRGKIKIFGPEAGTASDLVDHAIRIDAKIVFTGEVRREDDAAAFRRAASYGVRPVGIVTVIRLTEAQLRLAQLGPWTGFDLELLSSDG
jgi:hypothetical protein